MSQPTTINLISKGKAKLTLDFAHALRLLKYEQETGRINWKINEKSYEFKDNEIIRSARVTKESEE